MPTGIQIYDPDVPGSLVGQYTGVTPVKALEFLFIVGTLSGNKDSNVIAAGDFDAQCTQVFANVRSAAAD